MTNPDLPLFLVGGGGALAWGAEHLRDLLPQPHGHPCQGGCGQLLVEPGICAACDLDEQATWRRADTDLAWGYTEPVCRHGRPLSALCDPCETECVHGAYGPGCRQCREEYG